MPINQFQTVRREGDLNMYFETPISSFKNEDSISKSLIGVFFFSNFFIAAKHKDTLHIFREIENLLLSNCN